LGEDALILALTLLMQPMTHASVDAVPLSVSEALVDLDELNGKTIQIVGVLRSCGKWNCVIADNMSADAKALNVDLSKEEKFDTDTLTRHRLVIEGRFDATCLLRNTLCMDAATMMHDAHIVEVP
jgi:hypothetical protein